MTRKFFFFSEMGYNAYPLEAVEQYGYSALLFPNSLFDAEKARDLWQMFLCATNTTTTCCRCRRASTSRRR
jgi:hypothetical protein